MVIPPSGSRDGGGDTALCEDLCLPPSEHSRTVYCNQVHYGPMSGGFAEVGVKDYQVVVGAVRIQCEGNVDGGSGAE